MFDRRQGRIDRRQLLLGSIAAAVAGSACRHGGSPRTIGTATTAAGPHPHVELWSWFDLPPTDARSRELSGIAWDPVERVLWAVQDESASIVALIPDPDFKTWSFGKTITVDVGGTTIDLEGLVIVPNGFIVASEEGPRIIEIDKRGYYRHDIPVPARFREARTNKSFESLTASPSGRFLFTTTEVALARDGGPATTRAGTRLRIVRMDRSTLKEVSEHLYTTDPNPYDMGDWGVADLAAKNDDTLLVLERGWSKGHGNTCRIYETNLETASSCMESDSLLASTPVLEKNLRVDISKIDIERAGLPMSKQPQASPILDNYEGITLGPRLRDGRSTILMVSDDNAHPDQFARILVLALAGPV